MGAGHLSAARAVLGLIALGVLAGCTLEQLARPAAGTDPFALQRDAEQAYARGDWAAAAEAYRALAARVPKEAEPWFRLGNAYARLGRSADAVAAYREALVRDPRMSKAWHNLGLVQLREAAATFVEMTEHTAPDDPLHPRGERFARLLSDLLEPAPGDAAGAAEAVQ